MIQVCVRIQLVINSETGGTSLILVGMFTNPILQANQGWFLDMFWWSRIAISWGFKPIPLKAVPPITGFRTWETKNSNGSKRAASPHAASCSWGKGGVWCDAKHLVPSNQQLGLMLMNIQPSTHENGYTHRYLLKQLDFQADHWERLSHKTSPYLLDIPISMLVKTSTCFLCSSANKLSHDMSPQDVPNAWIVRKSPQLSSFGSLAANYH
jgi:hypothetical protein